MDNLSGTPENWFKEKKEVDIDIEILPSTIHITNENDWKKLKFLMKIYKIRFKDLNDENS